MIQWSDHYNERVLGVRERRVLEAVCGALTPPALDDVAPSPPELRRFVEGFVAKMPPLSSLGFKAALHLLEIGSLLSTGRRLSRHERARAQAVLAGWSQSRIGVFKLALKVVSGLSLMALYAAPSVRRKLELPC